ncbi:DEAD/DEAH box helicase [Microlunatus ginsengisoli]|uniref:DEAD/DEAH box helicase n=1 Tax=Microlunatus ginsengisoli TaxID=363863 RepID=A0ABP7APB7_9ACTN
MTVRAEPTPRVGSVDALAAHLTTAGHRVRRFSWPARSGHTADWPSWVPAEIVTGLAAAGIAAPWRHQVEAAEAAVAGRHVILATGTASGKSLGFLLPVLAATYGGADSVGPRPPGDRPPARDPLDRLDLGPVGPRPHTALYLSPTKALAHDQFRAARALGPRGWRIATLDGDTEPAARDWVRDWGTYVVSNPDMLHHSVLPQHRRWAPLLRGLRYVVVDEAHRYRGVFGAQVAAVLARLRRLAHYYGADPVFVLAAATIAEPAQTAARLLGVPADRIVVVDRDDSARPARELALVEPAGDADELTAELLARCVDEGRQTLAFTRSRRSAEAVTLAARRRTVSAARIEAYRAGYLAADRRAIESDLRSGEIRGVASTNALELGIDVAGLDAVLIDGYPGTRSSFWQQAGRAGRGDADALVVLVAGRHPLDRFLVEHPEVLLDRPVEATVLNPANPYVLRPHLLAGAQELPLGTSDEHYFGPSTSGLIAELARGGALRRRPNGWFCTGGAAAREIDLRAAGRRLDIVEQQTGRVLGVVDESGADLCVHEGAVYVHRGDTYLCLPAEDDEPEVLVRAAQPGYLTSPRRETEVRILAERARRAVGAGWAALGEVEVHSRVTGYLRRDPETGTVWDQTPLDLPTRTLRTTAVWFTLDPGLVPDEISLARLDATAHAAEHAWLGLLPAYAGCDPWDVNGASAVRHPDTGLLTLILSDALAGGAGFAEHGFAVAERWLRATADLLRGCDCAAGCPGCIVSAACGTTGRPLDKSGAALLLQIGGV